MKVFLDTNILLDVLAERKPFYQDSMRIWTMAESGKLAAQVSVLSFANCYYIVHKFAGKNKAEKALKLIRDIATPVDFTAQILNQSIGAGFNDFEDAVQYHSAVHAQAKFLITRNTAHFPRSSLPVLSPAEFLATHP